MNKKSRAFMSVARGLWFAILFFPSFSLHAQAPFRYAVIPENPRPGEPVTIAVNSAVGAKSAALVVGGKRLGRAAFFTVPGEGGQAPFLAAVLAVPSLARPGGAVIAVETGAGIAGEIAITIAGRDFEAEVIPLNPVLTGIRADPDPQKTTEANHLWSILNRSGRDAFHFDNFIPPVASTRRTSVFGSRRVYQYSNGTSDTSIHAGIDYGVPMGTPVIACGRGKVVLARSRIVTGNSVIVEHLPGVYTMYYHLDSIAVAEGVFVETAALLGYSGSTGLSTGPHLHLEIRVSGENADPDAFFARPVLDKNAIFSRINP